MTKKEEVQKDGIYIVCNGTYVGTVGGTPIKKPFEITVQLTDDPNYALPAREDKILRLAQKILVPNYFKTNFELYPDYRRWYECRIIDIYTISNGTTVEEEGTIEEGDINFGKMKRKELVRFCAERGLLTDPTDFSTIGAARQAVSDEWENKLIAEQDALDVVEQAAKKKQDELAEFSDILEFNDIK